ncbi:ZYRO0G10252p [Zygosaccharomyces rouxii]|uniref:ZYRO0G10252p n=1 Tax=Zygosaccharomyces rouxii (strain ATCC 2623 / CBS 732 / NBRC 1130 / NCYC 568 / NRRL Y-229) TaxID=559307 RepID=C5E070_ZYGRC|nr:uncharacterized protein ZYRO0G10252g [Zygosaccharomyces rouxii]KAH9202499.1 fungal-specific transcription factor domain-containing protein [Zygosaccharomyces rouxii]CAR29504.1 ZYRO0G10252p [Zygosaccharomyces rouxii]
MESGRVRRPRNKVNRACYNCRRRKIKCTGKYPCSSCEAYQCECLYFPGYVPTKSNTSTNGNTNVNAKADDNSWKLPIENPQPNKLQSNESSSSTGRSSSTADGSGKTPTSSFNSNQTDEDELIQDWEAGELASMPPIELNGGSVGFYKDDIEFQKKLSNLQQCLKQLKSIPNPNEQIKEIINSINVQVDTLVSDWEPEYDVKEYNKVLKNDGESMKSIETHLMKNKYADQVALTSFAVWTDTSKSEKNGIPASSFLANQPLVDDMFGLYSPVQALSLRGIGHLFQRCVKLATSTEKTVQMKSNLYLLLRFFDICIDHFNQSCVSIANPLESYLQRKSLLLSSPNTTSSVSSRNSANSKDLIGVLINRLPQPFTQNVTSIDNKKLLDSMHDDFDMFSLLLKMFDDHKKGFESLMIKITANPGHLTMFAPKMSTADIQDFIWYCEQEELLVALSYSYYNSTLYHFDEFSRSLEYFDLLLSLIDKQVWLHEKYGFEKVLDVATSYATGLGLSRWEFYVGLDELTAERRRESWWKYYCIEKQHNFFTGILSSINDSKMNCLLPRVFRDAGFSDHRHFVSNVHLTVNNPVFHSMALNDLAFYGECAVCQVISEFYGGTLYEERYTSIKNTAKPPFVKYCLLEEVLRDTDMLKTKLQAIKIQTKRLYDIAYSKNEYEGDSVCRQDKVLAVKHVLLQGCLLFYVSSAVNNLISRLRVHSDQSNVRSRENEYREILREEYINMTKLMLSLEDDYSVSRAFGHYSHVFLMVVSGSFSGCRFEPTIDEVVMVLRLFRRLRDISIYRENKDQDTIRNSKAYSDFLQLCTFVSILTNSLLQSYMFLNDLTKEQLFTVLADAAPELQGLVPLILNPKSEIYRHLMEPVQESGVHTNVKKMLEKGQKFPNKKRVYPKTAVQSLSPSNKNSPEVQSFPFAQADIPVCQKARDGLSPGRNMATPVDALLNSDVPGGTIINERPNGSPDYGFQPMFGAGDGSNKFNLGTVDEFVHKGDLNDLYTTLWSDLYSDESGQSILALNNFAPDLGDQN